MSLTIRPFTAEDAEFIVRCFAMPHAAAFMRVPSVERVRDAVRDPAVAGFILEDGGVPVGHLLLRDLGRAWKIAEIAQLVVSRPRQGYGRAAMRFALRHVFDQLHAHRCYLEVVARNVGACKLYEACGCVREGLFRDGFPADDGTFCDLAAYGMLAVDYRKREQEERQGDIGDPQRRA